SCRMKFLNQLFCLAAVISTGPAANAGQEDPNPPSIYSERGAWPITRQWTPAEARRYAVWLENVYDLKTQGTVEQRIGKIERIITDPQMNLLENPSFRVLGSNPQLPAATLRMVHSMIDCAKFTAFMPAYYAYRRGLPWMSAVVSANGGGDVRTAEANVPVNTISSFNSPSVHAFFRDSLTSFSSGNYRVELDGRNAEWSDTVPVAINKQYLMPGCANYLDGHSLLLAKVTQYGELLFINASTTNTRDIFTYNGMNTVSGITPYGGDTADPWAGCYQGLRAFRFPIAETDRNGRVTNVRRRTNQEMKDFGFSTEQYQQIREMRTNQYITEGEFKPRSFHDLVRIRMKSTDRIAPMEFLEEYAKKVLEVYQIRVQFVDDAWADYKANGPVVYPEEQSNANIFQALGRWETWSSPSSDVDRRNTYFYLADWFDFAIRSFGMMPQFVDLKGLEQYDIRSQAALARALMKEKNRIFEGLGVHYTNSVGTQVYLTLNDIEDRLYDLSFDPNHPPELRWGAPEGSAERSTAVATYTPLPDGTRMPMLESYRLQTYYRCVGTRETEASSLRGMFTDGFPRREKVSGQLAKWFGSEEGSEALNDWLVARGKTPSTRTGGYVSSMTSGQQSGVATAPAKIASPSRPASNPFIP
ncbi:MAG: hypothetical protein WD873_02335, partial [Candidatus Hydrogenedentales bacterium]